MPVAVDVEEAARVARDGLDEGEALRGVVEGPVPAVEEELVPLGGPVLGVVPVAPHQPEARDPEEVEVAVPVEVAQRLGVGLPAGVVRAEAEGVVQLGEAAVPAVEPDGVGPLVSEDEVDVAVAVRSPATAP